MVPSTLAPKSRLYTRRPLVHRTAGGLTHGGCTMDRPKRPAGPPAYLAGFKSGRGKKPPKYIYHVREWPADWWRSSNGAKRWWQSDSGLLFRPETGPSGYEYLRCTNGGCYTYDHFKKRMVRVWECLTWTGHAVDAVRACTPTLEEMLAKPPRQSSGNATKLAGGILSGCIGFWSGLNKK